MRPSPILLTLAVSAAVFAIPLISATTSDASSRHVRTHHKLNHHAARHVRLRQSFAREVGQPAARPAFAGDPCQGAARGIDCRIWPPPIEFDPDRRNPAGDGI